MGKRNHRGQSNWNERKQQSERARWGAPAKDPASTVAQGQATATAVALPPVPTPESAPAPESTPVLEAAPAPETRQNTSVPTPSPVANMPFEIIKGFTEGFEKAVDKVVATAVASAEKQINDYAENLNLQKSTKDLAEKNVALTQEIESTETKRLETEKELRNKQDELEAETECSKILEGEYDKLDKRFSKLEETIKETVVKYSEQNQKILKNQNTVERSEIYIKISDELKKAKESELNLKNENKHLRDVLEKFESAERLKKYLLEQNDQLWNQLCEETNKTRERQTTISIYKSLEEQNKRLQKNLDRLTKEISNTSVDKFADLKALDETTAVNTDFNDFPKLETLADHIQRYGQTKGLNGTKLNYDNTTIQAFIAALAASKDKSRLIILQGPSGIGKSSLPQLFAKATGCHCEVIPVQPSWRDNKELLGYDNDFTKIFKSTAFTKILYKASLNPNEVYLVVLDEMNLARIEYYFADFLSKLEMEPDNNFWYIDLAEGVETDEAPKGLDFNDGIARLKIGQNVWFVGTANEDESTNSITDKVYDRAQVLTMSKSEIQNARQNNMPQQRINGTLHLHADNLAHNNATEYHISKAEFIKILSEGTTELPKVLSTLDAFFQIYSWMDITFGNRMENQIKQWIAAYTDAGGGKKDAADYFLANKLLRKFEGCYDEAYKNVLRELYGELTDYAICRKKIVKILNKNFNCDENGKTLGENNNA